MSKGWLIAIVLTLPLLAEDKTPQMLTSTETKQFNVASAGTVRLDNSFGEVDIDGWDRPEVEVTVVRASERYVDGAQKAAVQKRLDSVQITMKQEGNDVDISTAYPPRNAFLYPLSRRSDIELHYTIHAPRNSKLMIQHNSGGVSVSGIDADIHASVINGEITLSLAPGPYAIDARCTVGKVYSDFDQDSSGKGPKLYLRVRLGDIVIQKQDAVPTV